ncbi:hypothetical protein, partial [Klebsiella michiganensis]
GIKIDHTERETTGVVGKAERLTWHKAWTMVSTGFSISYTSSLLPRAFATARPDLTRSLMRSRSNSAMPERNVASIRPYGDERSNAIPFMAITETFQFSSSRSVLSRSSVERPHRESSVTRIASIWGQFGDRKFLYVKHII